MFLKQRNRLRSTPAIQFIQSIDSSWKGYELFAIWVVKKIKPKVIVDLGFDKGLSTIAFAHRNCGDTYGIDWVGENNFSQKRDSMEKAFHNISAAIRMKYVKNINLIIGPLTEISEKWDREIDLLHIDCAHSYDEIKEQYESWKPFLKKDAVILIHDVGAFPNETGRFFQELTLPKRLFAHGKGLGIATNNSSLHEQIANAWEETANLPS